MCHDAIYTVVGVNRELSLLKLHMSRCIRKSQIASALTTGVYLAHVVCILLYEYRVFLK
jgi:hypothetical protein